MKGNKRLLITEQQLLDLASLFTSDDKEGFVLLKNIILLQEIYTIRKPSDIVKECDLMRRMFPRKK